jgi:hypothetical protein
MVGLLMHLSVFVKSGVRERGTFRIGSQPSTNDSKPMCLPCDERANLCRVNFCLRRLSFAFFSRRMTGDETFRYFPILERNELEIDRSIETRTPHNATRQILIGVCSSSLIPEYSSAG